MSGSLVSSFSNATLNSRDWLIPHVDLARDSAHLMNELSHAAQRVLQSGMYILGDELTAFEKEFAEYCGIRYSIGVDNGTSALILLLKALNIGPGDEVITAPNSFIASASSIALVGAKPVFADIGSDLNLDPKAVSSAITSRTKAVMVVHLTGRPADMDGILQTTSKNEIFCIEDAAQAVGATYKGKKVGTFGIGTGFSLHPLKNLHAFGDGGIITTDDFKLDDWLRKARTHGFRNRAESDFFSYNNRLDELQAALLRVQLKHLSDYTAIRRKKAFHYNEALKDIVKVPEEREHEFCVYQTYMIRAERRDALYEHLIDKDIEVKVHYPIPLHMQPAAQYLGYRLGDFPQAERAAGEILSLPLYPSLSEEKQDYIITAIRGFYED